MACLAAPAATKIRAASLTRKDTTCETIVSSRALIFARGRMYSCQMLRLKRLAAAIDITDAGTSAPIAMAPNAMPVNQAGNSIWINSGRALLVR